MSQSDSAQSVSSPRFSRSQNLNKITLRFCEKLTEAEILLRKIPQDNAAGHIDEILDLIRAKTAKVYQLYQNEEKCGVVIYEINGKKLHVLALYSDRPVNLQKIVWPAMRSHARDLGCETLGFTTMRAGFVQIALEEGFYISSVVMRCKV